MFFAGEEKTGIGSNIKTLNFSSLTAVAEYVWLQRIGPCETASFPKLTSIGHNLRVQGNTGLKKLLMPLLAKVRDDMEIYENNVLEASRLLSLCVCVRVCLSAWGVDFYFLGPCPHDAWVKMSRVRDSVRVWLCWWQ